MRFIISRNRSQIVKKSLIDTPAKSNLSEYNRTNLRISILLIIEYKIEHILNDLYYSNIKGQFENFKNKCHSINLANKL